MRDAKSWLVDHFPPEQNQVEIQGPWCTGVRSDPAALPLEPQEFVQELACGKTGFPHKRAVEEIALWRNTNRRCFAARRHTDVTHEMLETLNSEREVSLSVADVAAEGNRDAIQSSVCR